MQSLGDAFDGAAEDWERRRLYLGAALLFVGATVAAPGLARITATIFGAVGVASGPALALGIAVAALAVPVFGATLHRWIPGDRRLRIAAAAGVLLSTVAVAAFLVAVPPAELAGPDSVPGLIILTYLTGLLLALWSPVVAAGLAAGDGGRTKRTRSTTAFVRDERSRRPNEGVPADGGKEEEQLAFLLDRED